MASQLGAVRRDRRLRSDQDAELQARMQFLPQILANQASRKLETKRDAQFERTIGLEQDKFALQKKRLKQQQREAQAGMGLEAAKLGTTLSFGDMGKRSIGSIVGQNQPGAWGGIGDVRTGSVLGSGLTGFGVANILGGSKTKKVLGGALGGGLMNLLSGGSNSWAGAATNFGTGALFGGIGGLF